MKNIRNKKQTPKTQSSKNPAPKGFYIEAGHESPEQPHFGDDRITVSRFMSKASSGAPRSIHQLREHQLQNWPYQGDEDEDFLFGKIPDFFPDSFEDEE